MSQVQTPFGFAARTYMIPLADVPPRRFLFGLGGTLWDHPSSQAV